MQDPKIIIRRPVWGKLMGELNLRGEGVRETGAFLLGEKTSNTISHFICYDDLDPDVSESGIIIFNGNCFIPLWEYCSDHQMKVLADVHTHPGEWTGQSMSDRKHPMIAQPGHIAFIVPFYGTQGDQWLNGVGIHEFLGNGKWISWEEGNGIVQFTN